MLSTLINRVSWDSIDAVGISYIQPIVNCRAEVFILVCCIYLVIVNDNANLGWRVFPKVNAHIAGLCCMRANSMAPLPSFVYYTNSREDKTHPWCEPMEITFTLEVIFSRTCWVSPSKNSSTHGANTHHRF